MADAVALALTACLPGNWTAYNVGSGHGASIRDLLHTAEQVIGRAARVTYGPPAAEPAELVADASRIRTDLGWWPTRSDLPTILRDAWNAA